MRRPLSNLTSSSGCLAGSIALAWFSLTLPVLTAQAAENPLAAATKESATLKRTSFEVTPRPDPLHGALYTHGTLPHLVAGNRTSSDNGQTWQSFTPTPDFRAGLPAGYRRSPVTSVFDATTGRLLTIVNALDTPGLDPAAIEPRISLKTYYLRYRVSTDGGKTWLFDERMIQQGDFSKEKPFPGVHIGRNCIFLGDRGSFPVITSQGTILVPVQATIAGENGQLHNPAGANTYTDVFVAIGTWQDDGRIRWTSSERVALAPERSTRGTIEPTLIETADGRLLMVMRGSNERKPGLPAFRWFSVSTDGGKTWTDPEPWTWQDGTPFHSPSSMSTLRVHSSGRIVWVGNMCVENANGNSPRFPLVAAEVDPETLRLVASSLIVLDTRRPEDAQNGRLDLSHFHVREDRETGDWVVTYPRSYHSYTKREWAAARISLKPPAGN